MTQRRRTTTWARYVRVSALMGRKGEGFISPETQLAAMDRMIASIGGKPGPVFDKDIDRTGTNFQREDVQRAIAWVKEDPESRGLATYEVSRLGRNVKESLAVVDDLKALGARYASAQENIDLATPEGRFALILFMNMAELFSGQMGRRWRETHEHRVAQGLPHSGNVPLGYRKDGRAVVPDEETAPLVMEVFERYARGEPLKRVAALLSDVRGAHVPTQNAKRTLRNRFYVGEVKYQGTWHPGAHDRIVTEQLWDRTQFRLREEAGQPAKLATPRSPLHGLLKCGGCRGAVTGVNRGRGKGSVACAGFRKRYPGDRRCLGIGSPPLVDIEELFVYEMAKAERMYFEQAAPVEEAKAARLVARLEKEATRLRAGRTRLTSALARGSVSGDAFDEAMRKLEVDLAAVEEQLSGARGELAVAPADTEERAVRIQDIMQVMWGVDPVEGRAMLREVIKAVYVHWTPNPKPFQPWQGTLEIEWR